MTGGMPGKVEGRMEVKDERRKEGTPGKEGRKDGCQGWQKEGRNTREEQKGGRVEVKDDRRKEGMPENARRKGGRKGGSQARQKEGSYTSEEEKEGREG